MTPSFFVKSTLGFLYTSGRFYILRRGFLKGGCVPPLAHVRKDIVGYVLAELRYFEGLITVKVSVNNARAKSTEKHNDRTLYRGTKWKNEFARSGHKPNAHWDCCKCGNSFTAEKIFYERRFRRVLDEQNERARMNYKPELSMDEWHRRHMPQEMIIQLGSLDEPPGEDDYIIRAGKMTLQTLRQAGLSPISLDVHYDEATPHLHIRYVGIDSQGRVNLAGCLREHGVRTPLERTCKAMGVEYDPDNAESVKQLQGARPDLFTADGRLKVKSNTALNTLTNDVIRARAERLAEDMGYDIDTVRSKRRHLSISAYKTERDRQRTEAMLADLADRRDSLTAEVAAQQARRDELDDMTRDLLGRKRNAKIKAIADREQVVAGRECAVADREQAVAEREQDQAAQQRAIERDKKAQKAREGAFAEEKEEYRAQVEKRAEELAGAIIRQCKRELGAVQTERIVQGMKARFREQTEKRYVDELELSSPSM